MSTLIANNEEVDFVVRNYRAVKALQEAYDIAKSKLPVWIGSTLVERFRGSEALAQVLDSAWDIHFKESEFRCVPEKFEFLDDEWRLYYGVEHFKWDDLLTEDTGGAGPDLFLYFNFPERPKKHQVEWKRKVLEVTSREKVRLSGKGYSVVPDKDDNYLIKRFIARPLNLYEIADDPIGVLDRVVELLLQTIEDTKVLLMEE